MTMLANCSYHLKMHGLCALLLKDLSACMYACNYACVSTCEKSSCTGAVTGHKVEYLSKKRTKEKKKRKKEEESTSWRVVDFVGRPLLSDHPPLPHKIHEM